MTLRDKIIFALGFAALFVLAVGGFYGLIVNMEIGMLIMACSLLFMPLMSIIDFILEVRGIDE